jgi:hypothetical protein
MFGNLSQSLVARGITGGQNAGGGALAQSLGSLGAQEAGQQSQLLNQIQLEKGQGLQSALGMSLGEGMGLGQQGISALGIGQQAAQAKDQAQTAFWGSLVGGLSGLGGAALGNPANKICWVAIKLYGGCYTPEVRAIRYWLDHTWWMQPFTFFYRRTGYKWSLLLDQSPMLERLSRIVFDEFLKMANA